MKQIPRILPMTKMPLKMTNLLKRNKKKKEKEMANSIRHAADDERTIQDVIDSMSEEQQKCSLCTCWYGC